MADPVSLCVSGGALVISTGTAWLTLLRRGQLKMTRPTLFYLGPDGSSPAENKRGGPKVYVRMLLYSTAKRGSLIENMYVKVRRGETTQNFNVWVYRQDGQLSRGSGLYVSQDGVTLDHHFLLLADGSQFDFSAGDYTIEVFVRLVRSSKPRLLKSVSAQLSLAAAAEAEASGSGIFFDWAPDLGTYHAHSKPIRIASDTLPPLGALPPRVL
jgi:hypothetical protein